MQIEIDQSGKIADTKIATVLAFSDGASYSIYVSALTKRKLLVNLRSSQDMRVFYFELFAVLIFILLKDFINKTQSIIIDKEYTGREDQIKVYLINLIKKHKFNIDTKLIYFSNIGKKSRAHKKALTALRDKKKANKILTYEEIALYFIPKKKDRGSYR